MWCDYDHMSGSGGYFMMVLAWITYLFVLALIASGIAAIWKYLKAK